MTEHSAYFIRVGEHRFLPQRLGLDLAHGERLRRIREGGEVLERIELGRPCFAPPTNAVSS
jgi:hypothetical protein